MAYSGCVMGRVMKVHGGKGMGDTRENQGSG